jgi:hypothetical protein
MHTGYVLCWFLILNYWKKAPCEDAYKSCKAALW